MRNFQDTFGTGKGSFISGFSICMTVVQIILEVNDDATNVRPVTS